MPEIKFKYFKVRNHPTYGDVALLPGSLMIKNANIAVGDSFTYANKPILMIWDEAEDEGCVLGVEEELVFEIVSFNFYDLNRYYAMYGQHGYDRIKLYKPKPKLVAAE